MAIIPAVRFDGEPTNITNIVALTITDYPLYRGDALSVTLAATDLPAGALDGSVLGITAFLDNANQGRWELAELDLDVHELVATFTAKRFADAQTLADEVGAILQRQPTLNADDPELPSVHLRWNHILGGNTTDNVQILNWIYRRIARKGDKPSLDIYERELPKYGFTLAAGNIPPFGSTNISVIPLDYVRNATARNLDSYGAVSERKDILAPPLTRDITFTAAGIEYTSGGTTDAEGTHTPGGYHINIGQAPTLGEGAVLLEMRRYQELQARSRKTLTLALNPTFRVRDHVELGGVKYIVVGVKHTMSGNIYATDLTLARRYTPKQSEIQAGSPAPYNTSALLFNAPPSAPSVRVEYKFTAPNDAERFAGESVDWEVIGGGAVAIITPPEYGHPILQYAIGITERTIANPYERTLDIPNPEGEVVMPIINMPKGDFIISVTAYNAYGASPTAQATFTITAGTPEMIGLNLLTTDDLDALAGLTAEAQDRVLTITNIQSAAQASQVGRAIAISVSGALAGLAAGTALAATIYASSVVAISMGTLGNAAAIIAGVKGVAQFLSYAGLASGLNIIGATPLAVITLPITLGFSAILLTNAIGTRVAIITNAYGNGNKVGIVFQARYSDALGSRWLTGWQTIGDGESSSEGLLVRSEGDTSEDPLYAGQWISTAGTERHITTRAYFQIRAAPTIITGVDGDGKAQGGSTPADGSSMWVESPIFRTGDWISAQFDADGNYLPTNPGPPRRENRPPERLDKLPRA